MGLLHQPEHLGELTEDKGAVAPLQHLLEHLRQAGQLAGAARYGRVVAEEKGSRLK